MPSVQSPKMGSPVTQEEAAASAFTTCSGKWQHPPSFYCPISHQCMHDPVVLSDGHTYERRHIERWLQEHSTSPVTGTTVRPQVFPNHALRNSIEEYFQQVFSVHRRAIRKTIACPGETGLESNQPLLRTIDALMQCSLLVNADLSAECVLGRIMEEARVLVGAEVGSAFLVDWERQELYSTVNSTGSEIRIPVTGGIAGHVATTARPLVINDAYADSRFDKSVDEKTGFRTRNILCVPLKLKKGDVIGVCQLLNKTGAGISSCAPPSAGRHEGRGCGLSEESFTAADVQFLEVFASQAATVVAQSAALSEHQLPMQSACSGASS